MKVSIFTPTYNRAEYLPNLYESLINQKVNNFEWIIVDDGSSDNTESIVNTMIDENKIDITYFKQENSGKHIAINKGLDLAKGDWFFIVDSDDILTVDALSTLNRYIIKYNDSKLSGFSFRKAFLNKETIGGKFPDGKKEFIANMIERVVKYKIPGDMAEIFRTKILIQCKFDEIENEKFCAEGLMWNRTANLGANLLYVDKQIYLCEYLAGGLTSNSVYNRRNSPKYATLLYKELAFSYKIPLIFKIRAFINYWRFSFFLEDSFCTKFKSVHYSFWALISFPFGFLMKVIDDIKIR